MTWALCQLPGNNYRAYKYLGDVGTQGGVFVFRNAEGYQTGVVAAYDNGSLAINRSDSGRGFGIESDGNFFTTTGVPILSLVNESTAQTIDRMNCMLMAIIGGRVILQGKSRRAE
ncbi:hypothetical protein M5585_19735 [Serratia ureilytica]